MWSLLPSPVFVFFRVLISFLLLSVIVRKNFIQTIKKLFNFYVILSGVLLSLNWVFLFYAVFMIPVSEAIIFYYTGPVIAILFSPLLKEKINKSGLLNIVISFTGIIIMSLGSLSINTVGIILALLSGITYGLLSVTSKFSSKYVDSINLVFLQSIISIIILIPFLFIIKFSINYDVIIIIIISGSVQTVLALFLWYDSLKNLNIQIVSILSYLDPVFAIIFALVLLGQIPSLYTIIGGSLLIGSGIIITGSTIKRYNIKSLDITN
ncbi:MAG: DMT family transporter [Candidatus Thermoplasmatota archaeon]|nr:DMT family transporter [Candidatus Thermoplasmatota archaeon]